MLYCVLWVSRPPAYRIAPFRRPVRCSGGQNGVDGYNLSANRLNFVSIFPFFRLARPLHSYG